MIRGAILRILAEYRVACQEQLKDHPFAAYLRSNKPMVV